MHRANGLGNVPIRWSADPKQLHNVMMDRANAANQQKNIDAVDAICAKLEIYEITGKEVKHSDFASLYPGQYKIEWNAGSFASGIYFYRISASSDNLNFVEVKKMVLLR